jgi:hypothetical protein
MTSLAIGCLGWKLVTTIFVVRDIEQRGVPVNRWLVRILTCAYAGVYRRATLQQTGRVAPLFFVLIASTVLTIAFAVAAIVTKGA